VGLASATDAFLISSYRPGENWGFRDLKVQIDQQIVSAQNIKLVRLSADGAYGPAPARLGRRETLGRYFRAHFLFALLVALPTLASAVYFFVIAANRYESEIKFVVRSPATSAANQLSGIVQSSSVVRSSDDAYIVKGFMLSRDAMNYLVENAGLMAVFERPEADFAWRYPGLLHSANQESLFKHYLKFVSVDYDQSSGVATLRVQGFRPADAQRIAAALVQRSEILINSLNERSGSDAIRSALAEVENAKQRAHEALAAVTEFRNRAKIIDPAQASLAALNTIASLSLTTAEANATLTDLEKATPGAPQVLALKGKIDALQDQISAERRKLAGGSESLAPQLAEYERLILDQTFAEKSFLSALGALENARVDALRQRVFLEPVTNANLPDYPSSPYRIVWVIAVLASSLMCWRIVRTFIADTRSHAAN
jgi:capsular polysaccharide transport system permease protein